LGWWIFLNAPDSRSMPSPAQATLAMARTGLQRRSVVPGRTRRSRELGPFLRQRSPVSSRTPARCAAAFPDHRTSRTIVDSRPVSSG
jgi:hypothetical protein